MDQYLPIPMEIDPPLRISRKRSAEGDSRDENTPRISLNIGSRNDTPHIVRRVHRRRRHHTALLGPLPTSTVPVNPAAISLGFNRYERFNVYKGILRHPNLFFQFALRLPYPAIIDLYAIDKDFHYRLNKYSVSLIHDYAKYHAPLASFIFSWVLYPRICISDPMLRPMDGRDWLARDVPGFRWISMVLTREKIVRNILTRLALDGHRVPIGCKGAVMKYWVLMEMRTTKMRQALLRDKSIWTNADIIFFQLFLVKLDMRFSDPVLGNGICELSILLLTQRSLVTLWKVLKGTTKLNYETVTNMIVHTYPSQDLDTEANSWLDDEVENGMPAQLWGMLTKEEWDNDGSWMQPAVDMVICEGIRRGLNVQQYYLDFVMYGHVNEKGTNVPIPRKFRKDGNVVLPEEGHAIAAVRRSVIVRLDAEYEARILDAQNRIRDRATENLPAL